MKSIKKILEDYRVETKKAFEDYRKANRKALKELRESFNSPYLKVEKDHFLDVTKMVKPASDECFLCGGILDNKEELVYRNKQAHKRCWQDEITPSEDYL